MANDIETNALNGNTKDAWEGLMARVGLEYKDVPHSENLFYRTSGLNSSGQMIFVNDVLPKEILARDDSQETKRLTAVLMATSKAYNFYEGDSPHHFSECGRSLEEAVPFVSPDLQHLACYRLADIYGRKAYPSDDYTNGTREENRSKQEEYLLKALELAPNQSRARLYAGDYLIRFTEGGYAYKSAYQEGALNKEIELYEKALTKPADDVKVENYLHNELSKDYTCKAQQTTNPEERNNLEAKAKAHQKSIRPQNDRSKSQGC